MKPNGTKENNDLTYVDNNTIDTKAGECNATVTVNNLTLNSSKCDCLECDFKKLVEKYMRCEKRTLAEMLAMRDMDKQDGDDMLKKIIESPDTWKVHPEPINPYPYQDYGDFCVSAPNNKCIRGGGWFNSCIGCPYYNGIVYAQGQGTGDQNPNGYGYTVSSTVFQNNLGKHRLDD